MAKIAIVKGPIIFNSGLTFTAIRDWEESDTNVVLRDSCFLNRPRQTRRSSSRLWGKWRAFCSFLLLLATEPATVVLQLRLRQGGGTEGCLSVDSVI